MKDYDELVTTFLGLLVANTLLNVAILCTLLFK